MGQPPCCLKVSATCQGMLKVTNLAMWGSVEPLRTWQRELLDAC